VARRSSGRAPAFLEKRLQPYIFLELVAVKEDTFLYERAEIARGTAEQVGFPVFDLIANELGRS